jgi:RNA polymerase sigma-70 factor (ECF subfamily)
VQGRPVPDRDFAQQWDVVAAFYAATREGDFERLMEVLDPDVVLRVEGGAGAPKLGVLRGARAILLEGGRPVTLASFTIIDGKIVEIDVLMDPEQLAQL